MAEENNRENQKQKMEKDTETTIETKEPVLEPVNQQPSQHFMLSEKEAKLLIDEITNICNIAQSAQYLGETTQVPKSSNFYIEEIFRVMHEHGIIET